MAEPFTIYKLIVLYMALHSREALTNSQISDFVLNRDYTDYFQLIIRTVGYSTLLQKPCFRKL